MKKLFYIVLVIVALMVISRFVKEKSNTAATTTAVTAETSEPVTATLPACNPGDENCDPDAAKSTCNCEQPNGETVTIEQTVEEVEEINPDETAGDDETIINDEAAPETPAPAPAQAQPAAK